MVGQRTLEERVAELEAGFDALLGHIAELSGRLRAAPTDAEQRAVIAQFKADVEARRQRREP